MRDIPKYRDNMTAQEYNQRLIYLRKTIQPEKRRRPSGKERRTAEGLLITEVLSSIRHREVDYCFSEDQLRKILAFEPETHVMFLQDGTWAVWLGGLMQ